MSREALQETLSAVMDNEADELELRRVLAACGEDAELRSTWSRYQLARSVMHREPPCRSWISLRRSLLPWPTRPLRRKRRRDRGGWSVAWRSLPR